MADRTIIHTACAETQVTQPPDLQSAIDAAVRQYSRGRAFARPSGTEDAVRVYAEAATQREADDLAQQVARLVYQHAGGVGDMP